jgi:hypothetical protein
VPTGTISNRRQRSPVSAARRWKNAGSFAKNRGLTSRNGELINQKGGSLLGLC